MTTVANAKAVNPRDGNEYTVLALVAGFKIIADKGVTPPGTALWFPKAGVVVVGAGPGVDEPMPEPAAPVVERTPSVAELESKVAALEAKKRVPELLAKIAALEAEVEAPEVKS